MTIERNHDGSLTISDVDINGYLVTQKYMGYSKREAIARFSKLKKTGYEGVTNE